MKRFRKLLVASIAAVAIAAVGIGASIGLRWFMVETPSMGTAAPVGTLVVTAPVQATKLQVGDVISFHPPTSPTQTYTHRILAMGVNGITTKGDINGSADGWDLQPKSIIGKVVFTLPAVGWMLKILPLLTVGLLLVFALSLLVPNKSARKSLRLFASSMVFTYAVTQVRPFANFQVVDATPSAAGHNLVDYTVVNTGLMPMSFKSANGLVTVLNDGQLGVVHATVNQATNFVDLGAHLALAGWQLALLGTLGSIPLLISLWHNMQQRKAAKSEQALA